MNRNSVAVFGLVGIHLFLFVAMSYFLALDEATGNWQAFLAILTIPPLFITGIVSLVFSRKYWRDGKKILSAILIISGIIAILPPVEIQFARSTSSYFVPIIKSYRQKRFEKEWNKYQNENKEVVS